MISTSLKELSAIATSMQLTLEKDDKLPKEYTRSFKEFMEFVENLVTTTTCNAPVLGREPTRHGASVPLRSPVGNCRDTDVSLRHRIGKDDLCNTNMSRQNKNLTTTHSHSRKNAGTELTKSKPQLKSYKTSAGHKY